jgi:ankyrin repeat protein
MMIWSLLCAVLHAQEAGRTVLAMLAQNANPNICNDEGFFPLFFCVQRGSVGPCKALLESKASLRVTYDVAPCRTAFHYAAHGGHAALVSLLAEHLNGDMCMLERWDDESESALLLAVRRGFRQVWVALLDAKADVESLDPDYKEAVEARADGSCHRTPLMQAVDLDDEERGRDICRLLLERRANVKAKDYCKQSALVRATTNGASAAVCASLIEHKANLVREMGTGDAIRHA